MRLGGGRDTIGYQYTERILPVNVPVYVLGVAQEDGQIGADVLPVDEPPRTLMLAQGDIVAYLPSRGDEERRFNVSYRSEEVLGREMSKSISLMRVGAIFAFAFGTIPAVIFFVGVVLL